MAHFEKVYPLTLNYNGYNPKKMRIRKNAHLEKGCNGFQTVTSLSSEAFSSSVPASLNVSDSARSLNFNKSFLS